MPCSRLLSAGCLEMQACYYSIPCSRLLSESTKSQNERDSFFTVQFACNCGNIKCVCWYSVRLLLKVRKPKMSVTVSLPCRLLGNAAIQNARAGIPYRVSYHVAGCFLKVRKAKMSVTVSLPCRLLGNATIQMRLLVFRTVQQAAL